MIVWPAIIRFGGEAELTYVPSQQVWEQDAGLHAAFYRQEDLLIDSTGSAYLLDLREHGRVVPRSSGMKFGIDEVLQCVRMHAANDGACCASKLGAGSIIEAIGLLI